MQVSRGQALLWRGNIILFKEHGPRKSIQLLDLVSHKITDGLVELHQIHKQSGYAVVNDILYCIGGNYNGFAPHDQVNYVRLLSDQLPARRYAVARLPCAMAQHSVHVMSIFLDPSCEQ